MKKIASLITICLALVIGITLAEIASDVNPSSVIAKTELSSDGLSLPIFDMAYIACATGETIPEFRDNMEVGSVSSGFTREVFKPPL